MPRQGGLGGREEFDSDVVAATLPLLAPEGALPVIGHTGIMLGRFSSNLFLFIDGASRG